MLKKIANLNILSSFVKNKSFLFLFFSCFFNLAFSEVVQIDDIKNNSLNKQEERIEKLKTRLAKLEKAKDDALKKYLFTKDKLFKEELSLIEKKVKSFKKAEKKIKKDEDEWHEFLKKDFNSLFLTERKVLTEMLSGSPNDVSKEKTKLLLDKILNIITSLNELKTEKKIQ